MNSINLSELQIGQRIFCSLYGGNFGVIFNITGDQKPETVSNFSKIIVSGGNAYFDVVYDNGSVSRQVPEAIIRGVQWTIYDDVVGQDTIDALLSHHETVSRSAEEARHAKEVRQHQEREQLRQDFAYLKPVSHDERHSKTGARNLRTELKRAFPSVKFSVRMSGGYGMNIHWCDGPTTEQVEAISDKYQEGSFNGMEDIYERNSDNVWPDVFGGDNYVFTRREYSDRLVQIAIDLEYEEYAKNYKSANIDKPTLIGFRRGDLHNVRDPLRHFNGNHSVQSDIHCRLSEYSEIDAIKPNTDVSVSTAIADHSVYLVRQGTKPGFVEIIFNDKPGDDVRTELKGTGFRWSRANSLWYGKQDRLPDQFSATSH